MEHKYIRQEPINIKRLETELGSLSDKTVGYKHQNGVVTVYVNTVLTSQEILDIGSAIQTHDGTPEADLRIYRALPRSEDPLISDFSILGFRKQAPHYDRGRKVKAEYICAVNDDIIVEKIFSDILDENGKLHKLQIEFRWYDENNNIALTKTEIAETYSKAKAKTVQRERRERAIDFLISEGEDTPIEPIMNTLISHYETAKDQYIKYGSSDFADAIANETDETINGYLDIRVPFTSNNAYTVPIRESILYQISSLDEAGLLATLQPV